MNRNYKSYNLEEQVRNLRISNEKTNAKLLACQKVIEILEKTCEEWIEKTTNFKETVLRMDNEIAKLISEKGILFGEKSLLQEENNKFKDYIEKIKQCIKPWHYITCGGRRVGTVQLVEEIEKILEVK